MSDEFLGDRRTALIEKFFHRQDQDKLEKMRAELSRKKTLDELREAMGVGDDLVLEGLFDLGMTGETVTAIALVPLVHVAWADGTVQPKEKEAIMRAAENNGVKQDSMAGKLLLTWLSEGEPEHLFDTWQSYIQTLSEKLKPDVRKALCTQIVDSARGTAEAAGGFLGLGAVSKAETSALEQIEAAFTPA